MKIGLFGGSFNPPHLGHRIFAQIFKEQGNLDQLWVMVSPVPPHKNVESLVDYEHRLSMSKINFEFMDGVIIKQVEEELPPPHFTINTLKYLLKQFPKDTFYLCIGEDSLRSFETWNSPNEILNLVDLLVVKRDHLTDTLPKIIQDKKDRVHWLNADTVPISSELIRYQLKNGIDSSEYLEPKVLDYITKHKLYGS